MKSMKKYYTKKHSTAGFTLVELLVCLVLLSIVVVIGFGLLLTTNVSVENSRSQRRVMDNVSFALEHLSRSITYGHNFSCSSSRVPSSCDYSSGGSSALYFEGSYLGTPEFFTYQRQTNTATGYGYIARTLGSVGTSVSLTDELIDIQEMRFYVYHGEPFGLVLGPGVDPEQPRVTVVIRGVSHAASVPQEFFIQTTLSQRDLKL